MVLPPTGRFWRVLLIVDIMYSKYSRRIPPYLPLMALVTAAYLTVEVPFSAHLLDVLGGMPTAEDIDAIERFGRVLTGCAVAIAVMGWIFARDHKRTVGWWDLDAYQRGRRSPPSFGGTLVRALLFGAISVGATYYVLDRIAVAIGEYSSGEERRAAFRSVLAKNAIAAGRLADGSFAQLDVGSAPAWKAFVSVAPALDTNGGLLALAGVNGDRLRQDEANRRLGTPAEFKQTFFGESFNPVRGAYLDYKDGSARYLEAKQDAERKVRQGWNDYVDELRSRGMDRRALSPREAQAVRDNVVRRGIPVPRNWHPHDRDGFVAAYRGALIPPIEKAYRDGFERFLGTGTVLPTGLDFEGFLAQPAVQRKIRSDARLPASGAVIRPNMSDKDFHAAVYAPTRQTVIADLGEMYKASAGDFAIGGRFDAEGRSAAQMAFIPSLALTLSLAGALLHICKLSGFLAQIVGYRARILGLRTNKAKWGVGMAVSASMAAVMMLSGNAVTSSEGYARLTSVGGYATPILTGSIAIQPMFQPIGHAVGEVGGWRFFTSMVPETRPFKTDIAFADPEAKTGTEGPVEASAGNP